MAMVPDALEQNNFISAPGRTIGFGFDPFVSSFGAGFGGFNDFPMPQFSDMMAREDEGANGGQSYSSSTSSSYSSSMGEDGKKH